MKKLLLIYVGIFCSVLAFGQTNFQKLTLDEACTKARAEKKLIFVDCYTSWCGPCKMLANNVFTKDEVADYFNQTFVNAKYDMEKDEDGIILKTQFGVKAFPTLVFVDPATQQVVHRMVGAGSAEWLVEGAKTAGDPQNNLTGLTKRYEAGERNGEFLGRYLAALVASEYLNTLSEEQLATKENWDLVKKYVSDPLSGPLKKVMQNRDKFYAVAGKEVVDYKLDNSIMGATMALTHWRPGMGQTFDEKRNEELIGYLLSVDYAGVPAALAQLYTAAYIRKGDFRGLLDKMKEVLSYNMFRSGADLNYFQNNIEALTLCDDKALVEEGIKWIDEVCAVTPDFFSKANLMNSKARLQTKIGDTLGADKSKMEEEKYNKEGEKRSGGKVFRAMRMN